MIDASISLTSVCQNSLRVYVESVKSFNLNGRQWLKVGVDRAAAERKRF